MLSRSGSSTSTNHYRTKSSTSVGYRRQNPPQPEPVNPQIARTHALIAAHRAFDRSRASTTTDVTRSESVLSRQSGNGPSEAASTSSPASHLRRQRSTLQSRVPKLADTLRIPGEASQLLQTNQNSGLGMEFGIAGENYGAEPSSYRKLKRSKSLLTPVRPAYNHRFQSPMACSSQAPTLRTTTSSPGSKSPSLKVRLKRSLNFLRQPRHEPGRVITAPALLQSQNTEAIALARTQYLQEVEHHKSLSTKPSLNFSSKANRIQRSFRKSVRTTNTSELGTTQGSSSTHKPIPVTFDTSLVPVSLSGRLKKFLGISKRDSGLPPQQLEASRAHFNIGPNESTPGAGFDRYLEDEVQSQGRSKLYLPSDSHLEACDQVAQLCDRFSQVGSSESRSSKSRVTSWTSSTATASVAGPNQVCEPKRLSVIKEDGGPHQPSSSAGRHIGGVPTFQQPLNIPHGQIVDSQRVYSALLKRIDEENKEIANTQAALKEIHNAQEQDDVVGHYLFSAPTIRRVESTGSATVTNTVGHDLLSLSRASSTTAGHAKTQPVASVDNAQDVTRTQAITISRFLPVSGKRRNVSPAPKTGFLGEAESQNYEEGLSHLDTEAGSVRRIQSSRNTYKAGRGFAQSTDSFYSRTTNGGTNIDYTSPANSTEYFHPSSAEHITLDTCLDPKLPQNDKSQRPPSRDGANLSATHWKGWMEHHRNAFSGSLTSSRSKAHIRELTQINSDETDTGEDRVVPFRGSALINSGWHKVKDIIKHEPSLPAFNSMGGSKEPYQQSSILPILKEVTCSNTPQPNQGVQNRRSQRALSNRTNVIDQPTSEEKPYTGLRRISPTNVTRILKGHKSQPTFSSRPSIGKENSPINGDYSPPASTPGRQSVRARNGNSTSRLRHGRSTAGLAQHYDRSTLELRNNASDESPSDQLKTMLSARLSKPFDMSVPDRNRPFDSIYLGKREDKSDNRLSVAQNCRIAGKQKPYGDLGWSAAHDSRSHSDNDEHDSEPTALPSVPHHPQRSTSGLSLGSAGKRMVNGFLKSRRKYGLGNGSGNVPRDGDTTAFI